MDFTGAGVERGTRSQGSGLTGGTAHRCGEFNAASVRSAPSLQRQRQVTALSAARIVSIGIHRSLIVSIGIHRSLIGFIAVFIVTCVICVGYSPTPIKMVPIKMVPNKMVSIRARDALG